MDRLDVRSCGLDIPERVTTLEISVRRRYESRTEEGNFLSQRDRILGRFDASAGFDLGVHVIHVLHYAGDKLQLKLVVILSPF